MRLNSISRDTIVRSALAFSFDKEEERLKKTEDKLARRMYNAAVPLKVRNALSDLPPFWVVRSRSLRFNILGRQVNLEILGEGLHTPDAYHHRFAIADKEFLAEFEALHDAKKELEARRAKAETQLRALLGSYATFKTLREAWPEGERFYEGLESGAERPQLPSVPIGQLNELLKIAA